MLAMLAMLAKLASLQVAMMMMMAVLVADLDEVQHVPLKLQAKKEELPMEDLMEQRRSKREWPPWRCHQLPARGWWKGREEEPRARRGQRRQRRHAAWPGRGGSPRRREIRSGGASPSCGRGRGGCCWGLCRPGR